MREGLNYIVNYFYRFSQEEWLWLGLALVILCYILYNKRKYVALFDSAVIMAETSFKHGDNKNKLNAAIKFVEIRTSKLPLPAKLLIRYFLSKKRIIFIIEKTLQKFSNIFGSGKKVNIDDEDGENGDN